MAYRQYIKVSPEGSVISDCNTSTELSSEDGWIFVPKRQRHLLGTSLDQVRYDEGQGLSRKARIRLSVGRRMFPADNETICAIGVRDVPDPDTAVRVMVDANEYYIKQGDDLALCTDKVGQFSVAVVDPYHYAPIEIGKSAIIIQTYEPEE